MKPVFLSTGRNQVTQAMGFAPAFLFMCVALLTLYVHAVLSVKVGAPGFIWLVGISILFLSINKELALTLMLATIFMQNAFISIVSPDISNDEQWMLLQGTSFLSIVMTSIAALPIWMQARYSLPKENRVLINWLLLFFGVTIVYTVVGIVFASFSSVALYARLYLTGGLLLAAGVSFGLRLPSNFLTNIIRVLAVMLIVWGVWEFFFTYSLYELFNIKDFMRLKFYDSAYDLVFDSVRDAVNFSNRAYLNLSGSAGLNVEMVRMNGPSIHPITFAYCLAFCSLVCFINRSPILATTCAILAILVGAKGPIIIILASVLLYAIYATTRNSRLLKLLLIAIMVIYTIVGIIYGIITSDFHVVGFMGGIKGFLHNPLGHGIGMGGTLSNLSESTNLNDLENFQKNGADYGFESTIGVVIYQIGIGMVVLALFYHYLYKTLWNMALTELKEPRVIVVPLVLALLAVTGIFQEEAFSPAAWGLWLMYGGYLLGRHWRSEVAPDTAPETAANETRIMELGI